MPYKSLSLLILILCSSSFTNLHPQEQTKDQSQALQLHLADSLFQEKKYELALRQYSDFLTLYPQSFLINHAFKKIATIYERDQRFELALQTQQERARMLSGSIAAYEAKLEVARLYALMGEDNKAKSLLSAIILEEDSAYISEKAKSLYFRFYNKRFAMQKKK